MRRRGLVKCSSLFFIVLLMCPKCISWTSLTSVKENVVRKPGLIVNISLKSLIRLERLLMLVASLCDKRPLPCIGIIIVMRSTPTVRKPHKHLHKKTSNNVIDAKDKFKPNDWSTNIVRQNEDDELKSVDNEPGFDLSDDEIRKFKLWPKGIVPYYIDVLSFNDKVLRDRIRMFLNTVNSLTRLSFLEMPSPPKDDKTRWVFFVNRRGQLDCSDHSILNFTNEGVQHVILGYDCISTGGELAEAVLSIVGIPPQHNSPDRDEYIKVAEENIMPAKKYLFQKLSDDNWLFHHVKYDFSSAGHYHHHKYSANGRATIEFQDEHKAGTSMGDNHGFTKSDIKKLRMLYNYIVMKKENKVPECDRLFKKGSNFVQSNASFEDPKPRKKPNKYLGIPESKSESAETDNSEKDTKEESGSQPEGDITPEKESRESETDVPHATRKMDLKSLPMKLHYVPYKIDPLFVLSDYQTGDEYRRKSVQKKTTSKGNK